MLGKFLTIFFGCHKKPERSFFINGRQLPVCARCTGILCGYFLGILISVLWKCPNWGLSLLLAVPMLVDGIIQRITTYLSNNPLRFITGILFGIATIFIIVNYHILIYKVVGYMVKNNIIFKKVP